MPLLSLLIFAPDIPVFTVLIFKPFIPDMAHIRTSYMFVIGSAELIKWFREGATTRRSPASNLSMRNGIAMRSSVAYRTGESDMKKSSLALALALAASAAGARSASAATVNALIHSNSCFNATPGTTLSYSQWGPYNSSTTTGITVNCPVSLPSQNYTSFYIQLSGWSRNNSATKLSCTANMTGYDGYNRTSATATVPYNTGAAMTATATVSPSWQNVWPYVTCYIPPNNGNGISYLGTIYVSGTW